MANRGPYPGERYYAERRPGTRGPARPERAYEDDWDDLGGSGVRYGGSSSGGYGMGGAALDYRDVVGSRYDYDHPNLRQVFPEEDHRGRGPRNYRRSDQRIREDVSDRLTDDPYVDASDIEVAVENGEVTLVGSVMSRPVKHRVEDIAESVSGVTHVQNNLRIQRKADVLMGAGRSTGGGGGGG
jgi:hypothetical protein